MKTIIKNPIRLLFLLMLVGGLSFTAIAQKLTRKEREAQKTAEVNALVESGNYVFRPQYANPMRGGSFSLTPEYDFRVSKDTLIAYLPYFGQAYQAPIDPMDGGIHFTSTHFTWSKQQEKNGGWEIYIKPADAKGVEKIFFNISEDGYGSLQITSSYRDPITFQGYIEQKKQKG